MEERGVRGARSNKMTTSPYAYGYASASASARQNDARFQDSIGFALATEGSTTATTMGAAGGLQIWPKLQAQSYQELKDSERMSLDHKYSDSLSSNDTPPRRRPVLHAAASQPDLRNSSRHENAIRMDPGLPPPIPSSHQRSQKLDFSKFFSRKSKSKDKGLPQAQPQPQPQPQSQSHLNPFDLPPPPPIPVDARPRQGSAASNRPSTSSTSQRTQATVFDRNPTENAKVNVRRPPKGIKHWFDGLDGSDDDLPEVVTPLEPVTTATFRPALGPGRSRVAPTSRVSPACEPVSGDYFHFQAAQQQYPPNLQERSMLNLSSDDESDQSEPSSPARWNDDSIMSGTATSEMLSRSKSNDTRQSTFSMQTTMTSGSIPIINADNLTIAYRTPLPPLPAQYQNFTDASAMPAPLRNSKQSSGSPVSRARAKSSTSTTVTSVSDASTNGHSHVMAVTQEEMALLEMMRRKRAEMHGQQTHPARRNDFDRSRRVSPSERNNSVARSTVSSTLSHASGRSLGLVLDSPDGTAFPAPPSARVIAETENMNYFGIDDKQTTRSSTTSTPHSSILAELEAPMDKLTSSCYSSSRKTSGQDKPSLPYNSADPYQLAPDLEFSAIDLLPLPARTYSPSLTGTCSSAMTPEFSQTATGFAVAESDQGSDGDRPRHSVKSIDSAEMNAFAAWGRLGGS